MAAGLVGSLALGGCGGQGRGASSARLPPTSGASAGALTRPSRAPARADTSAPPARARRRGTPGAFPIRASTIRIVEAGRSVRAQNGASRPRTLLTIVRYPSAPAAAPYPLIVFGHGFAVTPGIYARLLDAWASAGYVVAAPVFPLANAGAPGGPYEPDLVHQPLDMSYVISRVLALSRAPRGALAGLVDPARIAVSGQSDGGDTALAVAYDPRFRDRRVDAAVVLSGAEIPYLPSFPFPAHGPPLLAVQGGADTINPPRLTQVFYAAASPPKYLLWLPGAGHLPPYTSEQPQLGVVERASLAFLGRYLEGTGTVRGLLGSGSVPGVAWLSGSP